MIQTAKEFFRHKIFPNGNVSKNDFDEILLQNGELNRHIEIAIEFAKLHRNAILEAASDESNIDISDLDIAAESFIQLPNSILKCYPEENIK